MDCFIHPAVYLSDTEQKGRGMFCREDLPEGFVVETAPVVIINQQGRRHLRATLLKDYIFGWHSQKTEHCCIALGYISIYNHAYTANCNYLKDPEGKTMSIKTVRPIAAGEELTINYNGTWDDHSPVWFDAV